MSGFSQTPAQKRAMEKLLQDAAASVQTDANAKVQNIIRDVDDAFRGRPVGEVQRELERRLIAMGARPGRDLPQYAQAISDGTLER